MFLCTQVSPFKSLDWCAPEGRDTLLDRVQELRCDGLITVQHTEAVCDGPIPLPEQPEDLQGEIASDAE